MSRWGQRRWGAARCEDPAPAAPQGRPLSAPGAARRVPSAGQGRGGGSAAPAVRRVPGRARVWAGAAAGAARRVPPQSGPARPGPCGLPRASARCRLRARPSFPVLTSPLRPLLPLLCPAQPALCPRAEGTRTVTTSGHLILQSHGIIPGEGDLSDHPVQPSAQQHRKSSVTIKAHHPAPHLTPPNSCSLSLALPGPGGVGVENRVLALHPWALVNTLKFPCNLRETHLWETWSHWHDDTFHYGRNKRIKE